MTLTKPEIAKKFVEQFSNTVLISFRCQLLKSHFCTAAGRIEGELLYETRPHNHPREAYESDVNDLKRLILQAAESSAASGLRSIFNRVTRNHPNGTDVTFKQMEGAMYKRRAKSQPKVPYNATEFNELIQSSESLSSFFQGAITLPNGRVCGSMFANNHLLEGLRAANLIAFDGTFFVVPKQYYQLFTVFFVHEHHFFPAVTVLMTGKSHEEYLAVYEKICDLVPEFNPQVGMADFERASRNAAHELWDDLLVHGCFFHYSRAVFKNLQKLGLSKRFCRHLEFKRWMKLIMALPLLPSHMIHAEFEDLLSRDFDFDVADAANLRKFKIYLRRTWIDQMSPDVLSVHGMDSATNNGSESFHSWLKQEIKVHKPNAWNFVTHLNEILEDKSMDFRRLVQHGADSFVRDRRLQVQNNIERRRTAEQRLAQELITPRQFLNLVSYTFAGQIQQMVQALRNNPNVLNDDPEAVDVNALVDPIAIPDQHILDVDEPNVPLQQNQMEPCLLCLIPRTVAYAFVPCGHQHCCQECCDRLLEAANPRCPYCRTQITGKLRLYPYLG
jgi:hypothetical protein